MDRCYKVHGYPPGYKFKNPNPGASQAVHQISGPSETSSPNLGFTTDQCKMLLSMLSSQLAQAATPKAEYPAIEPNSGFILSAVSSTKSGLSFSHNSWILDSGATCHITCSLDHFNSYNKVSNYFVTLPNKELVPVHSVGSVMLHPEITLHNVLYIPSFSVNLLSVSALLTSSNTTIIFQSSTFFMQDLSKLKMIGKGELLQGLYVYTPHPSSPTVSDSLHKKCTTHSTCNSVSTSNNVSTHHLWHSRLGHLSNKCLQFINKRFDLHIPERQFIQSCSICPM